MISIPFNFQPASVSVKTSSYTIPTGKYAYVVAFVTDGAFFSIDSVTALTSEAGIEYSINAVSQPANYAVPPNYRFEGQVSTGTSTDIITVGGVNAGELGSDLSLSIRAGSGDIIKATDASGVAVTPSVSGFSIREGLPEANNSQAFWLPSGTEIGGGGEWKATVSLFNELTT